MQSAIGVSHAGIFIFIFLWKPPGILNQQLFFFRKTGPIYAGKRGNTINKNFVQY